MYWSDESTNLHPKAPLPPPSQPQHQQEQPEEANRAAHTTLPPNVLKMVAAGRGARRNQTVGTGARAWAPQEEVVAGWGCCS